MVSGFFRALAHERNRNDFLDLWLRDNAASGVSLCPLLLVEHGGELPCLLGVGCH